MRVAALAIALLAASCAVDGAADVRAWRSAVPDDGATLPADGRPLDVRTSMRLANARSETLAIEGEAYVRALVDRRRAAAAFLPVLRLSPGAFLSDAEGDSRRSGIDVPLESSWSVAPAPDEAETRRAAAAAGERFALLQAAQDALLLDTARAHFAVLRAERRAEVLRSSIRVQDANVDDVRARLDAGLVRPIDLALSESRAATTRADLVRSETDARNARTALSYLVAADVATVPLDGALDVPPSPPSLDDLLATAAAERADVVAAGAAEAAATAQAEAASGRWWPSISADLSVFLARHSEPVDVDWRSFLEVRIPVFERGLIEAGIRDALSRLRESRLRRERLARLVRRDVETARGSLLGNGRRIDALHVRVDAARRALAQAEGLRDAGLSTNLELLRAQDDLLAAELDLADAELERRVLHLDLARAAGTLRTTAGLARPSFAEESDAEAR